jgi:hypothetical protein
MRSTISHIGLSDECFWRIISESKRRGEEGMGSGNKLNDILSGTIRRDKPRNSAHALFIIQQIKAGKNPFKSEAQKPKPKKNDQDKQEDIW